MAVFCEVNEVVPFKSHVGSLFRVPPPSKKIVDRSFSILHFFHNLLCDSYFSVCNVVHRVKCGTKNKIVFFHRVP